MLSDATIAQLFEAKQSRKRKRVGKGRAFIRNTDGQLESVIIDKMGDFDLGKHVGKVGTMVRSRKGRTYHAPNGRRTYQPKDYDTNGQTVVAYKLK
jgi:hypothetical protein